MDGELGTNMQAQITKAGLVAMDKSRDNGFPETYSALQTKVADRRENPLALISTAKLYEVQQHCSLTSHMWDGDWFLANRRSWEKLPASIRDIVAKNINEAGLNERADLAKWNTSLQDDLTAIAPVLFPEVQQRGARPGDLVALLAATEARDHPIHRADHDRIGHRVSVAALQGLHAGRRKSGIGGADGKHGLYKFTQTPVVYIQGGNPPDG